MIEGHAYLVTAFLGMILAFSGIEMTSGRPGAVRVFLGIVTAAIGTGFVVFGLKRYHRIMVLAFSLSEHATCPKCNVYASFDLTASGNPDTESSPDLEHASMWMRVKCRRCGNEWMI